MVNTTIKRILRKIFKKRRSYSLDEIDLKLRPYLLKIKNGFFVEAGANNGISQSNTLYFEKNYGWKGILVEPVPELASEAKKNRPMAIVEEAALVSFLYEEKTISMRYGGLMSLVEGAMKTKAEEDKHIENAKTIKNINTRVLVVPTMTLSHILEKHGIKKIDFLSLDVEGYELEALRGLDLTKYSPKYILVEARYKDEIDIFMKKSGYAEIAKLSHHDYLYESN